MNLRSLLTFPVLLTLIATSGCTLMGKMGQVLMDPSVPVGALKDQATEVAFSLNVSATLTGHVDNPDLPATGDAVSEQSAYVVSLSAEDPYALTEQIGSLLVYLHERFPSPSAEQAGEDVDEAQARAVLPESALGSYAEPDGPMGLSSPVQVAAEPITTPIAIKILQLRDDSLLRNSPYQLLDEDPAKALRSTYIRGDDYLLSPGQFKFVPHEPVHADTRFIAVIADYSHQDDAVWQQVLRIPPRGHQIVLSVLVNDTQLLLKEES